MCVLSDCTEDVDMEPLVVTEKILYVSGEILRLTGRVLSVGEENLSDHGFVISTSSDFQDEIRIALGPKGKPGRFYGDTELLNPEMDYYCKTYIVSRNNTVYGNVLEVQTLSPDIISFTPKTALPGARAKIFGKNLSKDTRVFFGPNEAKILNIQFESRIDVEIPPIPDTSVVSVRVTTKGRDFEFDEGFEYIFGVWNKREGFINPTQIWGPVSMKMGNKYVYGLGRNLFGDNKSEQELYQLDLGTWSWESVPFNGLGVSHPFSSDGFFGGGEWQILPVDDLFYTDLWYEYVPSVDGIGNVEARGTLPFKLFKGRSFKMRDQLFVLGGYMIDRSQNRDVWAYDELSETWSVVGQTPFHIDAEFPFFTHNDIVFFITLTGEMWQYFPLDDQWEYVTDIPFTATFSGLNYSGLSEVIDDKVYIGLFYRNPIMWEYNIPENSWKEKVEFPGDFFKINSGMFTHEEKVYTILFSNRSKSNPMEIWEFDPKGLK